MNIFGLQLGQQALVTGPASKKTQQNSIPGIGSFLSLLQLLVNTLNSEKQCLDCPAELDRKAESCPREENEEYAALCGSVMLRGVAYCEDANTADSEVIGSTKSNGKAIAIVENNSDTTAVIEDGIDIKKGISNIPFEQEINSLTSSLNNTKKAEKIAFKVEKDISVYENKAEKLVQANNAALSEISENMENSNKDKAYKAAVKPTLDTKLNINIQKFDTEPDLDIKLHFQKEKGATSDTYFDRQRAKNVGVQSMSKDAAKEELGNVFSMAVDNANIDLPKINNNFTQLKEVKNMSQINRVFNVIVQKAQAFGGYTQLSFDIKADFMGEMSVKLIKKEKGISVAITASNAIDKEMIALNLEKLADSLQQKGLKVYDITVDSRDYSGPSTEFSQSFGQGSQYSSKNSKSGRMISEKETEQARHFLPMTGIINYFA